MTRMSKQGKRRAASPRKRHYPLFEKSGAKQDNLKEGYKKHINALSGDDAIATFIPEIKARG